MMVSINQPAYLPWLGYFDRIARSDLHIVLDQVQIERNTSTSFTNRNKIRTAQGWSWLTVPVKKGNAPESTSIIGTEIDGSHWAGKHWQSLMHAYKRGRHFGDHQEWFQALYQKEWHMLPDLLRVSTQYLLAQLDINTPILYSSEMKPEGSKAELVLNICKSVGATGYLSGPFGRDYLNEKDFSAAGIDLVFHDYAHPTYRQLHNDFEPYMSVVDLLFTHGPSSCSILRGQES